MIEHLPILLVALPLAILFLAVGRRIGAQRWTEVGYFEWVDAQRDGWPTNTTRDDRWTHYWVASEARLATRVHPGRFCSSRCAPGRHSAKP